MQQAIFIVLILLVVVVAFVWGHRWKKKTEKKMGNDLEALIETNDWSGVCRFLQKQLIIWGIMLALCVVLLIYRITSGMQLYTPIIFCAFVSWRFIKLVNLYIISYKNQKIVKRDNNIPPQVPIEHFLHDCKITRINDNSAEIKRLWLDACERGRREGFCPILLDMDSCFYDSLDDSSEWSDEIKRREWQSKVSNINFNNGKDILQKRIKQLKEEYEEDDDVEWTKDVVGEDEHIEYADDFAIFDTVAGTELYLVEVPVNEPWQVFTYLPFGNWNECPKTEEHMAIAKYWYEKYGASVLYISNDVMMYHLPNPVSENTMHIAEEHLGYCEDILQGGNLASLASHLQETSIWFFWWD